MLLIAVFIGGVAGFSNLSYLQRKQTVSASDLEGPTLPVMCVDVEGMKINRMWGYTMEMDVRNMRNALIPMTTRRTVTVSYKAFGNQIRSVSYEVSAPDTGKVIENAKIGNFRDDGEYRTASFSLSEPILMNREYPVKFTIQTDTKDIYYYARIVQRSDPLTDEYVAFVYDFYEGCMNPQGSSDLNTYLETDETITNNSFTNVNLKSSLRQVTWGSLRPEIYRKAVPTITDIYGETCSINNDYLIKAEGDGREEIYHVSEYYRLRYYNGRMMLLNFTRSARQIVDPGRPDIITTAGINLGVADRDIVFRTNETGDTVVFIEDGELWEYTLSGGKLARIFSFHDVGEGTDERHDNNDYGISIIRATEGGGVDFIVYGYMSRGHRAGQLGVSICHYNAETTAVTERAFIPYDRSYEQLASDLSRLNYINNAGEAYLYLGRCVYRVELASGEMSAVLTDISPDCFISSATSDIAWMEEMQKNASTKITVMELESGDVREIEAGETEYLRVIGFLNHDLVYGIADRADLVKSPSGAVVFAMKQLKIESFDGTLVKDYRPEGYFITGVEMEPGLARIERARRTAAGYEAADEDNIINNRQAASGSVTAQMGSSSRQGTVLTIKTARTVTDLKHTVSDFRMRYISDTVIPTVSGDDGAEVYYIYGGGKLLKEDTEPAPAVMLADANVGTALNAEWQYIYERGNKKTKNELHNEDIPEAFLQPVTDSEILAAEVPEDVSVIDLSGCTLDQVLYCVSSGRAVATRLADGSPALIVGYDRYNTLLLNYQTGEHYYMGINDSTASMLEGGNIFVTYIERQATIKGS